MADRALGMIETRGLIASIEAADAMLKASNVQLLGKDRADAGLITILIEGETAAVKSAIDAGAAAAQRVGELVSTHIIPRPDDQIVEIILKKSSRESKQSKKEPLSKPRIELLPEIKSEPESQKTPERKKSQIKLNKNEFLIESEPVLKSISSSTINRLKEEALGEASKAEKSSKPKSKKEVKFLMAELEVMNVHQLRRYARDIESFPIKGREISRANRGELLDFFKSLQ